MKWRMQKYAIVRDPTSVRTYRKWVLANQHMMFTPKLTQVIGDYIRPVALPNRFSQSDDVQHENVHMLNCKDARRQNFDAIGTLREHNF